jgi:hypothetical protein
MSRLSARWRSRATVVAEQWSRWRDQWQVERDIEAAVSGPGPVIVGPWYSEVGYEVLYWLPFLRWVMAAYRVPAERIVAVTRGGAAAWYGGIADRHVELFDVVPPQELRERAAAGPIKQRSDSEADRQIIDRVRESLGLPASTRVLHPSVMFRWFTPFWSGHDTLGFVERHMRHALAATPVVDLPIDLPREYAVAKFYGARSLPDTAAVRAQLRAAVAGIAERMPVVHLDTGLGLDDHADYTIGAGERLITTSGRFDPRTNLAVQTRIIAGAQLYIGTCGSLAWLAPLLGVPTIALYTDASFLHAHLHVARRVYERTAAAAFAPMDISGIAAAGVCIGAPAGVPAAGS